MTSSHPGAVLPRDSDRDPAACPAMNTETPGFAACSLREGTHSVHQLRCEDTGELLGEWTDSDRTFREPAGEIRRHIEFSDTPDREVHYGDVA